MDTHISPASGAQLPVRPLCIECESLQRAPYTCSDECIYKTLTRHLCSMCKGPTGKWACMDTGGRAYMHTPPPSHFKPQCSHSNTCIGPLKPFPPSSLSLLSPSSNRQNSHLNYQIMPPPAPPSVPFCSSLRLTREASDRSQNKATRK